MPKSKTKDLVQIIRDNPGCVAVIDNDCWRLYRESPSANPFEDDPDEGMGETEEALEDGAELWDENNLLARDSDQFKPVLGDGGYGSGCCYGGDILQALAVIVGIKVESV